jgi:ribosomal protein S17E
MALIPLVMAVMGLTQQIGIQVVGNLLLNHYSRELLFDGCHNRQEISNKHQARASKILNVIPGFRSTHFYSSAAKNGCTYQLRVRFISPYFQEEWATFEGTLDASPVVTR